MNSKVILVAEDDPNNLETVRRLLKEASVLNPVQCVPDGAEAIGYLGGSGKYADRDQYPYPALLLLDLVMPQRSGLSVLRWIRSRPKSHDTPFGIIVMTQVGNKETSRPQASKPFPDQRRAGEDSGFWVGQARVRRPETGSRRQE